MTLVITWTGDAQNFDAADVVVVSGAGESKRHDATIKAVKASFAALAKGLGPRHVVLSASGDVAPSDNLAAFDTLAVSVSGTPLDEGGQ